LKHEISVSSEFRVKYFENNPQFRDLMNELEKLNQIEKPRKPNKRILDLLNENLKNSSDDQANALSR